MAMPYHRGNFHGDDDDGDNTSVRSKPPSPYSPREYFYYDEERSPPRRVPPYRPPHSDLNGDGDDHDDFSFYRRDDFENPAKMRPRRPYPQSNTNNEAQDERSKDEEDRHYQRPRSRFGRDHVEKRNRKYEEEDEEEEEGDDGNDISSAFEEQLALAAQGKLGDANGGNPVVVLLNVHLHMKNSSMGNFTWAKKKTLKPNK